MSFPVEFDFAVVKAGDGADPEVFTIICGLEGVTINNVANSNDQFRRDCAKPGKVPTRRVKVTSRQWDITASGVANAEEMQRFIDSVGIRSNYEIDVGQFDGTDEGNILGTFSGPAVLTASNIGASTGEGTQEITLAGEDELTWTAAA